MKAEARKKAEKGGRPPLPCRAIEIRKQLLVDQSLKGVPSPRINSFVSFKSYGIELYMSEDGDVRKKVNNYSARVRAAFLTNLDGQVFLKPK